MLSSQNWMNTQVSVGYSRENEEIMNNLNIEHPAAGGHNNLMKADKFDIDLFSNL